MKKRIFYFLYKVTFIREILERLIAVNQYKQSKSQLLRKIYMDYHNIDIGLGSYGGCFNYKNMNKNVKIGKYCSFAKDVYYFNANHPLDKFTTHPLLYNSDFKKIDKDNIVRSSLNVGNDVWIGQNSIILSNVKNIGNGAIVGAGSVVTKDVPPYAIVAGIPAKIIKYRFNANQIKIINQLEWWNWSEEKLNFAIENFKSIENFLDWGLANEKD